MGEENRAFTIDPSRCPAINNGVGSEMFKIYFEDLYNYFFGDTGDFRLTPEEYEKVESCLDGMCPAFYKGISKTLYDIFDMNAGNSCEMIEMLTDEQVKALNGVRSCKMLKDSKLGTFLNNLIYNVNDYNGCYADYQATPENVVMESVIANPRSDNTESTVIEDHTVEDDSIKIDEIEPDADIEATNENQE